MERRGVEKWREEGMRMGMGMGMLWLRRRIGWGMISAFSLLLDRLIVMLITDGGDQSMFLV